MIRQAISCDICGAEKKQTNHWFVAWEQAGELRVSGWNSRNRLRAGSKHLCGQVCLHKLADDFMARVIAGKTGGKAQVVAADELAAEDLAMMGGADLSERPNAGAGLTAAYADAAPAARLLPSAPKPPLRTGTGLVAIPDRARAEALPPPLEEPPRFSSRNWRAEAWERERERTQRGAEHRPEIVARRISQG